MLKLYKKIDGSLQYHEAWCNDGTVTEHWGAVGETGESRDHPMTKGEDEEDAIFRVLQPALDRGFVPVDMEDHAILLVEYCVKGFGTKQELEKRHSLQNRLNGTLGWTGLGECDGGSSGSGTMEVCCYVIDFDVAKRVVEADLKGTEFADYTRIYCEDDAA